MRCYAVKSPPTVTCKTCIAGVGKEDRTIINSAGPEPEVAMLCGEVSSEEERRTCGAGPGVQEEAIVCPLDAVPRRAALG